MVDIVRIRIWRAQDSKSLGHVSLQTLPNGQTEGGIYASFWPQIPRDQQTDLDNELYVVRRYQGGFLRTLAYDNIKEQPPPDQAHLNIEVFEIPNLQIDAIHAKFNEFRDNPNNAWHIAASTPFKWIINSAWYVMASIPIINSIVTSKTISNCCDLVYELLKAGGAHELQRRSTDFSRWLKIGGFLGAGCALIGGGIVMFGSHQVKRKICRFLETEGTRAIGNLFSKLKTDYVSGKLSPKLTQYVERASKSGLQVIEIPKVNVSIEKYGKILAGIGGTSATLSAGWGIFAAKKTVSPEDIHNLNYG